MSGPQRESAPEHVRNALALISLTLQLKARQAGPGGARGPEGLSVLVPVATLKAVQRRLEAALVQLEPRREV